MSGDEGFELEPWRRTDQLARSFVWQHNLDRYRRWHVAAFVIPLEW